jgi:YD repeat-containing protein
MRLRFERSSIDYTAEGVLPSTNMLHTEYIYNADGTLAEKKTSGGKRTTYGYDSEGNVTSEYLYTDSSNYNYKTYTYNHRGQTKTESLRVASADIGLTGIMNATLTTLTTLTTTNAYDKDGYLASILRPDDGGNIVITYGRDAMGRERSITTAKGASSAAIEYDYSPMGDKTSATDARGKTTIYTYDKRGFLTHITDPEGGVTHYEYDRAGRKIAEVSPKNYVTGQTINAMTRTTYAYDKMDRPTGTARVSKNAAGAWVTVEIGSSDYDAAGNLKKSADKVEKLNNVYTIYDYDKAGRLTETKLPRERNNLNQIVYDESARVWDAAGRIISETDFNGHQTIYTYDDDGNVLSSTKEGVTNAYTWDKLGNKLSETDGNGNTTLWQYNAFGKVKKTIYPTLTYPTVEFGDADDGSDFDLSGVVTGYTNSAASGNIKEVRLNADCSFKSPYHHFKWWYAGRTL